MLRYALIAVGTALALAVVLIILPVTHGPRPEPKILTAPGDSQAGTSFTIGAAPPPAAAPPASAPAQTAANTAANPAAPAGGDLDALMAKLRASAANQAAAPTGPDATVTGQPPAPGAPATPAPAAPPAPVTASVPPPDQTPAPTPVPPPPRWGSVTAQGTRWRISKSAGGYTLSIDLGAGQVADVHVLPAFANLDPASINVRVDYLRDTILQNFSDHSAAYTFSRDGSVTLER